MSKRRILVLLGLFLLFELLVWAFAYAVLSDTNRILFDTVLTACGMTVLAVYVMIWRAVVRGTWAGPPAPATPVSSPAEPVAAKLTTSSEDDQAMAALIAEANERLSKSPSLASQRLETTVDRLPLYLLLGFDGVGKTSTFVSADISPELLSGKVYRDSAILPTRLCNLWFAGGALVVEPSGRFLSETATRLPWLLNFFSKSGSRSRLRRLLPLREREEQLQGVFLFCDVRDFIGMPDVSRQAALARRFQERLREIGDVYKIDFPVYVIFTNADSLPYFQEYFARLTEREDQQVLGSTLQPIAGSRRPAAEEYADAENKRISVAFNNLYYSLAEKRMIFLEREFDRSQRPMIYEFPRELKKMRAGIVHFLVDVFRPNPLQPGPMLRGFYLTGIRQVASALNHPSQGSRDRESQRLGEATRLFRQEDLQRAAGIGNAEQPRTTPVVPRWSFVSQLFTQSIIRDRGTAGAVYVNRRIQVYRRIGLISVACVALLSCALSLASWLQNRSLLQEVETAMRDCRPLAPEMHGFPTATNLQQIDVLRSRLSTLLHYRQDGAPLSMRFGMYSGNRILPEVHKFYFDRFRNYFLDRVVQSTAAELGTLHSSANPQFSYEAVYNNLKSYRTMTVSAETSCKPDPAFSAWLMDAFRAGHELDAEASSAANRNIAFYVGELSRKDLPFSIEARKQAVDNARDYLNQFGGEQRIYRNIIDGVDKSAGRSARLYDYAPKYAEVLGGPVEVEAAFSVIGRDKVLDRIRNVGAEASGESCVLGTSRLQSAQGMFDKDALQGKLRNLYVGDYIRKWQEFLRSSRVISYRNTPDAAHKLTFLQDTDSPLLGLLFMASENTTFPPTGNSSAPKLAPEVAPRLLDRFSYRFGRAGRAAQAARNLTRDVKLPEKPKELSTDDINRTFQPVHQLFSPDATRDRWTGDRNHPYLMTLTEMQRSLDALAHNSSASTDVGLNTAASKAMDSGLDQVKFLSESFIRNPENIQDSVKRLLSEPFENAHPYIVTDFGKAAAKKLDGGLGPLCSRLTPLLRKFPFNAGSGADATLDEVSAVFAPGTGALWTFFDKNLSTMLVKRGHHYVLRPDATAESKIAPEFLVLFNRLAQITDALYPEGEPLPRMRYKLNPITDANLKGMALNIGGDRMTKSSKVFTWPSATGSQDLVLLAKLGEADVPFASYQGLWSIFRMMNDADVRASGSHIVGLTNISHGSSRPQPVLDKDGNPITVRLEIQEFPGGIETSFDRNFFTQLRCPSRVAEP